ncbi:GlsB/YeaQ/YmgE family stress response membrane protein [Rhodomicrobium sp. R_RK_3]|nr:GlsB/YeaQ/YmgE family stress response membrane protein [Rhodomicrobium sp. R_RK_3]
MRDMGGVALAIIMAGVFVGWLGGLVTGGSGFGSSGNIIAGTAGSIAGFYLLDAVGVGFGGGPAAAGLMGAIGALSVLFIAGRLRR